MRLVDQLFRCDSRSRPAVHSSPRPGIARFCETRISSIMVGVCSFHELSSSPSQVRVASQVRVMLKKKHFSSFFFWMIFTIILVV